MTIVTEIPTAEQAKTDERETAAMEEGDAKTTDAFESTTFDQSSDELTATATPTDRTGCYKKIIIGLVLLGIIVFVIVDSVTNQYVRNGIIDFLAWIQNNIVAGVFGFVAVYFVATIFFVPGSILTLGAGFVFSASLDSLGWGVLLGTCAVWVGASLGAIAAFLLGRYLFRDGFVGRLTQKFTIFEALDNSLKDKGLRIMILLRLSPIIPFNVLNYIAGVTGVQFWHYVLANFAMLPGTILYVFLGASAGSLAEIGGDGDDEDDEESPGNSKAVTISVIVVGVVFGILAVGISSYYAKQELDKILEKKAAEIEETNEDDNDDNDEAPAATNVDEETSM